MSTDDAASAGALGSAGAAASRPGRLYVVATPIGNLEDMTPRAARILSEVDRVLAEDTRRTRQLLRHLGVEGKPVDRMDEAQEHRAAGRAVERLVAGETVALVSDAGAPVVSDPGAKLVNAAAAAGVEVVPLPGPSAVSAALMAAGFAGDRYRFFGFLPRSGARRREVLAEMRATVETLVFFEAPTRMASTLDDLATAFPERPMMVARELTKLHEDLIRGAAKELAERERERTWQGEITVVVGPDDRPATNEPIGQPELDERIDELAARGMRAKDIAKALSLDTGWKARAIYARITERKG